MKVTRNNIIIELTKNEREALDDAFKIISSISEEMEEFSIIKTSKNNKYDNDDIFIASRVLLALAQSDKNEIISDEE
jgi:hypothetical protein